MMKKLYILLKIVLKLIKYILILLGCVLLIAYYFVTHTGQAGRVTTKTYFTIFRNDFDDLEKTIVSLEEKKEIEEIDSRYDIEVNNFGHIQVSRCYENLIWLNNCIKVTYDDREHAGSYNNSGRISKRISGNRRYRSDVNGRQSDDF